MQPAQPVTHLRCDIVPGAPDIRDFPVNRLPREFCEMRNLMFQLASGRPVGIMPALNRNPTEQETIMTAKPTGKLKDGAKCKVIGGVHEGKSGIVRDIKTGKTGHVSITVVQPDGERFKTLAKNVVIAG